MLKLLINLAIRKTKQPTANRFAIKAYVMANNGALHFNILKPKKERPADEQ